MSLSAGTALADGDSLVIGTDATYPPFESLDAAGKFVGFDIDIANALCRSDEGEMHLREPGL